MKLRLIKLNSGVYSLPHSYSFIFGRFCDFKSQKPILPPPEAYKRIEGHLNPGLFNHKFFNPGLFNHEILNHGVGKFMVEKSGVGKFMVEMFSEDISTPDFSTSYI